MDKFPLLLSHEGNSRKYVLQTVVKSAVTKSTSRDFKEKINNKDRYE